MSMSVDYHPHKPIKATSKKYSEFVTFEVDSDVGRFTLYLHSVEDAKALFSAATEAVTNLIHLEAEVKTVDVGA